MDFCLRIYLENSVNAVIGGLGMFLSFLPLKSLNSLEKIQLEMMCAWLNGNTYATIISCDSPINASEEIDIITFYNEQSSFGDTFPNTTFYSLNRQRRK